MRLNLNLSQRDAFHGRVHFNDQLALYASVYSVALTNHSNKGSI